MKSKIGNDKVIKSIVSATASMLALTTTVSAVPIQAFAEEGEVVTETPVSDSTETQTPATTESVVITSDSPSMSQDSAGDPITVENAAPVVEYKLDGEASDKSQTADKNLVLDYTEQKTVAEVQTTYVVVDENGENVVGKDENGDEVDTIIVENADAEAEEVKTIEAEDGSIVEVTSDMTVVKGYFNDNGEFVAVESDDQEIPVGKVVAEYVQNLDDAENTYKEVTTNVVYSTTENENVYLGDGKVDDYEVKAEYSITDEKGNTQIVTDVVDTDGNVKVEQGKETVKETVETTKTFTSVCTREEVTIYYVYSKNKGKKAKWEWKVVTKEEYESAINELGDSYVDTKTKYEYTVIDDLDVTGKTISSVSHDITDIDKANGMSGTVTIGDKTYYVKPKQEMQNGHDEGVLKTSTKTEKTEQNVEKNYYYVLDGSNNEIRVSPDDVVSVKTYNIIDKNTKEVLVSGLTSAPSLDAVTYTKVNNDYYKLSMKTEDGNKDVYLTTDEFKIFTSHKVTFTETTSYYYESAADYASKDKNISIDGKEYLVKASFRKGTKITPDMGKMKLTQFDSNGDGIVDSVKVVIPYTLSGSTEVQYYEETLSLEEFGESRIATLNVSYSPTFTSSEKVTFEAKKETETYQEAVKKVIPGEDGTSKVSVDKKAETSKLRKNTYYDHIDVEVGTEISIDGVAKNAKVVAVTVKQNQNGVLRTYSNDKVTYGMGQNEIRVEDPKYYLMSSEPITIQATIEYMDSKGQKQSFVYETVLYMNEPSNECPGYGNSRGFDYTIPSSTIKEAIAAQEAIEYVDKTRETVVDGDITKGIASETVSVGKATVSKDVETIFAQAFVSYDVIQRLEDGSTHYDKTLYSSNLLSKDGKDSKPVAVLVYTSKGYSVFEYETTDEEGNNETKIKSKLGDYATLEEAYAAYFASEAGAVALKQASEDYVAKAVADHQKYLDAVASDPEQTKVKDSAVYQSMYDIAKATVEDRINELKENWLKDNGLTEDKIESWDDVSEEAIEAAIADAIAKGYVKWYVLKTESDGYHFDGMLMIPEFTVEVNGHEIVVPPTAVPGTPEIEEETIVPTITPASSSDTTYVPTVYVAPTEETPVFTAPAAVLGANRVEEAEEAAPAAPAAGVLGARRTSGAAVLGARRDATTGDTANAGMYASILGAAAFAGAAYEIMRRRKREDAE